MFFISLLIVGDLKWVQIQDYDGQSDVQIALCLIVGLPLWEQPVPRCARMVIRCLPRIPLPSLVEKAAEGS